MHKIYYGTLPELSRLIQSKAVSCQQIMTLFLDRIAKVNPALNAVVQFDPLKAIEAAQKADEALAHNQSKGPLHGIPFTVKDCCYVKDFICSTGTDSWKNFRSSTDATCVKRLKDAGMIVLGLTNAPELLAALETDNIVYGRTNNPYDLNRTPGGSSGGEASIIAAGGSPFGIGSDGGGSIRIPAHFCGVVGFKPTQGLLPLTGFHIPVHGLGWIFPYGTFAPIARHVEDIQMMLPALAGYDLQDPFSVPVPLQSTSQVSIKSLRIAYYMDDGLLTPDDEIATTIQHAVDALAKGGASLKATKPSVLHEAFELLWGSFFEDGDGGETYLAALNDIGATNISAIHQAFIAHAKNNHKTLPKFLKDVERIGLFRANMQSFIESYDVIICPAYPTVAPLHGGTLQQLQNANYCMPFNLTGWPSMVLRCGTSPSGLPIGIQIIARPWHDHVALGVGRFLEHALGGWQPSLL